MRPSFPVTRCEHHLKFLAAVVLAGFCGIRSDEIHGKRDYGRKKRQDWDDIHLKRKFVQVTIAKTNTSSSRKSIDAIACRCRWTQARRG
jgi:hypothetical protein